MKNLTQRLIGSIVALGLAACVSGTEVDENNKAKPKISPYAPVLQVAPDIGYKGVKWDKVDFTAITINGCYDEEIYLANMRFESYLPGEEGIRVSRVLTDDEINELNIDTRKKLADFLKGRVNEYSGYVGPNLLF